MGSNSGMRPLGCTQAGCPGGVSDYNRAPVVLFRINKFREFESPQVRTRVNSIVGTLFLFTNGLAESARA